LEEAGTTEVLSAAEAPLAIMPDPVATKKRTGFGPYPLPGLGPETPVLDSAAECVEANSSTVSTAVSTSSGPKKRTGLGPHALPGLGSETAVLDSLAECVEANASEGSDRSQHSFRPKKRTGFGPHLCPQIRGVSKDFGGYVRSSEASEVFDLKPTSGVPRYFVKFGDGDHSGTA
jgi:hypothetical protein